MATVLVSDDFSTVIGIADDRLVIKRAVACNLVIVFDDKSHILYQYK